MRMLYAGFDRLESPIKAFPFKHDEPPPRPAVDLLTVPSSRVLIRLVAMKHGVKPSDITGRSRKKHIVAIRDEAIRLVRSHTTLSLPQIGLKFGERHHSTILNAIYPARKKRGRCRLELRPCTVWTEEMVRRAVDMRAGGMAFDAIAHELGVSSGDAVRRGIDRARARVRRAYVQPRKYASPTIWEARA